MAATLAPAPAESAFSASSQPHQHDIASLTIRHDAVEPRNFEEKQLDDSPSTPTRHSFAGLPGQLPLPDEPLTSPISLGAVVRSHLKDLDDDIDMAEVDADGDTAVEDEQSDNDSATSESQRPSKKKKGQRFFCTDFPPCQLSFTRSEHLARHIRKHTGERPFQCHCSRRFSRLDNLRQHAQTVHVNEDIPGDSLAATSTRFQRQVRTDRVRPTSSRSRASTTTSNQGGPIAPARGQAHARHLSTSSIASTASSFSVNDEIRRRQPVLAMAADNNKRPAGMLDEYLHSSYDTSPHISYSGMSTPTSQMYPIANPSGYNSARSSYHAAPRHIRRLSVPSSSNPYQSNPYASGQHTPTSAFGSVISAAPSGYASPTSSIFSGRLESETEVEHRRRTWHPNTQSSFAQRPATSGLSYHQTPDEDRPALSQQPAATQLTRLPGIESFDHAPMPTIRHPTSPGAVEYAQRPLDHALHQGLHRLDITSGPDQGRNDTSPTERSLPALNRVVPPPPMIQPIGHMHHMSMPEPATPRRNKRQAWYGGPIGPSPSLLQPVYSAQPRSSPEDSGSSDGVATPAVGPIYEHHPVILNHGEANIQQPAMGDEPAGYGQQDAMSKPLLPPRADSGFHPYQAAATRVPPTFGLPSGPYPFRLHPGTEPNAGPLSQPPQQQLPPLPRASGDMGRLEALVAVATSENRAS